MSTKTQRDRRTGGVSRSAQRYILAALFAGSLGCSGNSPYDLVKVSGTVKYEDGSLIPAQSLKLRFEPEAAPLDAKTYPRKGYADVNVTDGSFGIVTTHKYGDGLVAGRHKVLILADSGDGKSANLIPAEYRGGAATPVEIDTSKQPLEIRVPKPKPGASR